MELLGGVATNLLSSALWSAGVAITRGQRVRATVVDDHVGNRSAHYFVPVNDASEFRTPRSDRQVGDIPSDRWLRANRCMLMGEASFRLAIQAIRGADVMLLGARPRTRPIEQVRGVEIAHPMGGPIEARHLKIDLDDESVVCMDTTNLAKPRTLPIEFSISPGNPELFYVFAFAAERAVRWSVDLDFVVDGHHMTKRIPHRTDDGFITIPEGYSGITRRYIRFGGQWHDKPSQR